MQTDLRAWTVKDAIEHYNVHGWGRDFFTINEAGHVEVTPSGPGGPRLDLYELVQDLQRRGLGMPLLMRFSDILHSRVTALVSCFDSAIREYGYRGRYRGVYPIKVNQQHQVVEELVEFARPHGLGLEAGSKPELLAALALLDSPDALLVLNGYKDVDYAETALLSQKLGRHPIVAKMWWFLNGQGTSACTAVTVMGRRGPVLRRYQQFPNAVNFFANTRISPSFTFRKR